MTREQWLLQMIERLRTTFVEAGHALPPHIRVSCGWPTQRALAPSGKNRSIGQCFSTACSADGAHEVFVSPALDDQQRVAEVLVHELCHAVDNCRHGHGPAFRGIAAAVGLAGKMTATRRGAATARAFKRSHVRDARLPASYARRDRRGEEAGNPAPEDRVPGLRLHRAHDPPMASARPAHLPVWNASGASALKRSRPGAPPRPVRNAPRIR